MAYDIRNVRNITDLITYFSQNLNWDIDIDDFDTIEDVSYDFSASDIGLKEESFINKFLYIKTPPNGGGICYKYDMD